VRVNVCYNVYVSIFRDWRFIVGFRSWREKRKKKAALAAEKYRWDFAQKDIRLCVTVDSIMNRQKQLRESLDIINSTRDPSTFFSRMEFARECLCDIIDRLLEPGILQRTTAATFSQDLINFDDHKNAFIDGLIDRMETVMNNELSVLSKPAVIQNRIDKYQLSLASYFDKMTQYQIERIKGWDT
jgi:hypothetical protein